MALYWAATLDVPAQAARTRPISPTALRSTCLGTGGGLNPGEQHRTGQNDEAQDADAAIRADIVKDHGGCDKTRDRPEPLEQPEPAEPRRAFCGHADAEGVLRRTYQCVQPRAR